jgi:two-component system, cell cycle response regulator DivK
MMYKVLVAEDNSANRELLREILRAESFDVLEASNGEQALALIEQNKPDLVLLDINMPVLDGLAAIRRIREHSQFCSLKVIAVTAYAMREDRERILSAGFNGYLTKPIDMTVLVAEVKRVLSR